jgi:hypothetical protein
MDGNLIRNEPTKNRAIIFRCSDETFLSLLQMIRGLPNCYLIYSKSSSLKLILTEEAF